jgi:hypothetical protein
MREPLDGFINFFGRQDFTLGPKGVGNREWDCAESYMGKQRTEGNLSEFAKAGVTGQIEFRDTCFLTVHGTNDHSVSYEHAEKLKAGMTDRKKCQATVPIEGAEHMLDKVPGDRAYLDQGWLHVCTFLKRILGDPGPVQTALKNQNNNSRKSAKPEYSSGILH